MLTGIFTTEQGVIHQGYAYLKGFALETIVTAVLFSMIGYFNGHDKTVWVMVQGLVQTLIVRYLFLIICLFSQMPALLKLGLQHQLRLLLVLFSMYVSISIRIRK